jgi:predicted PurR-regulated permease PerM
MSERIRRAGQVAWAVVGLVALLAVIAVVAWTFRVVFPPLILAGAIVFILNPIVTKLQHRHVPRAVGTGITYLTFFGVLTLIGFLMAPLVTSQLDELEDEWPHVRSDIEQWINDRAEATEDSFISLPSVDEIEDEFGNEGETLSEQVDRVRELGVRVFHIALIFFLAPIIAFYLLVDLPHLRKVAEGLIPARSHTEVMVVAHRLNRAVGGFFRGQLMVAFIVGVMVSVGLAILDLPFWLLVGMVAGVFNIIPLIGPWIGAVPGVIIALTTRDVGTAVWVAVVMAGAQQVDNHFISPLVMQRAVKLHPAAVMLALLAGGTLGGFFGLLLAVPTAAVLKILCGHLWRTYVLGEPIEAVAAEWAAADARHGVGMVEDVSDDEVERSGAVGDGAVGADLDERGPLGDRDLDRVEPGPHQER